MSMAPNPCAILHPSASFSLVQQVIHSRPNGHGADWTRAMDVALIVTLPRASGPGKPDPHLDNRISGAA